MKPRNKYQEHIVAWSAKLPSLTDAQKAYGRSHAFPNIAYRAKSKGWCTCCGGLLQFPKDAKNENCVCPHCGTKLEIEESGRRQVTFIVYYTIATTCKGHQIIRQFQVGRASCRGIAPEFSFTEVVQIWIDGAGKETILARPMAPFSYYTDKYVLDAPMTIKYRNGINKYTLCKYDVWGSTIYPRTSLLPVIKRNGLRSVKDVTMPLNRLCVSLINSPDAEFLAKHGQWRLLSYAIRTAGNSYFNIPYYASVRVACRHKYMVDDPSLWFDYLGLLEHYGYDMHSPHYLCAPHLKEAHDKLLERKRADDLRDIVERKAEDALRWSKKYERAKAPYFGVCFGNGDITISVIKSVAEMKEEADAMHHCVFSAEYYKRGSSLILSAKDGAGNRLETIEVNLDTFQIVQSRGVCNSNSEKHDEILHLMNDNMWRIKKAV